MEWHMRMSLASSFPALLPPGVQSGPASHAQPAPGHRVGQTPVVRELNQIAGPSGHRSDYSEFVGEELREARVAFDRRPQAWDHVEIRHQPGRPYRVGGLAFPVPFGQRITEPLREFQTVDASTQADDGV